MGVLTPTSLDDALAALAAHPDALLLAGGTDLMVEVNEAHRRLGDDETIVAVGRVPELRSWIHDPGARTLRLGAGVTYAELERQPLAGLVPALAQAARTVGSPQIRNAATIGGNLATCSPAGDGLPVLAALEATVELHGADGMRTMPVGEFMTGVKRTALRPTELVTAITLPVLDGWQGYAKVGVRNAMVIAIAGACLAVDRPARSVRLALGSVAPDDRPRLGGRGPRRASRRLGARRRVRARRPAVRPAGGRGQPPDRRPSVLGGLPSAGRRRAGPPPLATGVPRGHVMSGSRSVSARAKTSSARRLSSQRSATVGRVGVCVSAHFRRPMFVLTQSGRPGGAAMSEHYRLHVNGVTMEVTDAWVGESLLYVLRERLGLMAAKGACEQGECGSCSVLVDGELVCSCLVLAASAVDQPIVTVEGLAEPGAPTDLQRTFVDAGAVQCGFCTPGLIMAAHALLERRPAPTVTEIREELSGNICRCTGYGRIIEAVQQVAVERAGAS